MFSFESVVILLFLEILLAVIMVGVREMIEERQRHNNNRVWVIEEKIHGDKWRVLASDFVAIGGQEVRQTMVKECSDLQLQYGTKFRVVEYTRGFWCLK